jgi:ATP-binding cassette subfamily B protein
MLTAFPFYRQLDMMDCGPTCLRIIAKHYGRAIPIDFLRKKTSLTRSGVSLSGIAEGAEAIGIHPLAVKLSLLSLMEEAPLPCIAHWKKKHFVVVYKIKSNKVYVADPAHGLLSYSKTDFVDGWIGQGADIQTSEGNLLLLEPTPEFYNSQTEQSETRYGFKFLFWYFKPHKRYIIQLFLGLLVGSLIQLIFPFLTQSIVDYGINYHNVNFIYLILLGQIILFISQSSVELIRGWILLHMTSRVNISLISDFLLKLMRLPIAYFDSKNTGDIIQRIYDHNRIQGFLSTTTISTLFSFFNLVIFGIILCYYNLAIFLLFSIGSVLYVAWTLLFLKKRAELDYKRFSQSSSNQNTLYQLISGMQEIKLNGSERRRRWEWEAIQVRLFKISMKVLSLSQTQQVGSRLINELQNITITFVAAKSVIDGHLTLGMMLSVQYIIGQLNLPINSFIGFIQSWQDAKISLERLSEIHNKKDEEGKMEERSLELPVEKKIKFNQVSFRYGGKSSPLVLSDLNFEIPEGKVTAIVGASGSGKTTLLKLLLRFYDPSEGNITVGRSRLDDFSAKSWRKACGAVMQDGFIFNDTIARNINESDSDEASDNNLLYHAAKLANVDEFVNEMPQRYETKIGPRELNLSGGQKQRILIARSIYKNPSYLFFDEATSALDANNEQAIIGNLNEFYVGKTVVVVAHRLSTVKNADQIIVLEKGKVVEIGNHSMLTAKKGLYYTLVKNQLDLGN